MKSFPRRIDGIMLLKRPACKFSQQKSLCKAFKMAGHNPKNLISFGSNIHLFSENKTWRISFKFAKSFWILSTLQKLIHKKLVCLIFREIL